MLQHFFAPQRRRFNVNTWMPSSSPSGYGMSPLECFMPSMLDIFEPLLDLSRNINVGRQRWNQPSKVRRNVQRKKPQTQTRMIKPSYGKSYGGAISRGVGIQKPMLPKLTVSKEMPQKYRIAIDCVGFNQQNIRTCVKNINGVYHLIVSCCSSSKQSQGVRCETMSTEFRRSYTLPRCCNIKNMVKYMCNGVFVIEFPLLEQPVLVKCAKLKPTVVKCQGQKMVSLRVPISEAVNRANLQCFVKDRDLILRFEYKIQPDTVSRVYCYTKIALPSQTNLNQLKCKLNKKRLLTVCAPLLTTKTTAARPIMAKFRCIHIERKLRHRISGKVPLIEREILGKGIGKKRQQITGGGRKQQQGITRTPSYGKQIGGVGKKQIPSGGIPKRTSGIFGELFGKVPEKAKPVGQVTPRKGEKEISKTRTQVPSVGKTTKTPVVPKKTQVVKPERVVSGQATGIKKTRSGTNIPKTSSGKNLQETGRQQQTKKRTGESKQGGISTSEQLHQIVGSGRKSPVEGEQRGSPEGRKSPVRVGL